MPALLQPVFFHDEIPQEQHVHFAAEKVLKAFAGVFTIGSPFRLNEVFSTAGTPVACAKRSIKP